MEKGNANDPDFTFNVHQKPGIALISAPKNKLYNIYRVQPMDTVLNG